MKGNQIDDLFREKLRHQKMTPPPSAWGAVEQNLPGKKKKGAYLWMSIAASLLVIATLGWLVMSGNADPQAIDNSEAMQASKEAPKEVKETEQPAQNLVAEEQEEKPKVLNNRLQEPAPQQLVAANTPKATNDQDQTNVITANADIVNEITFDRVAVNVQLISIKENLSVEMTASQFDFNMVMPVVLTDFHVVSTNEEMELTRKKKKFRVLNGIISIAKEVNTGKLKFSELRNAKNNFVVDDLKYGSKEVDSDDGEEDDDDKPDADEKE